MPIFTKSQTELVRGYPMKDTHQDTLDELLTLSDTEIHFWRSVGIDPYYMYLDGTIDLVDQSYVEKNKKLLLSDYKPKTPLTNDEAYEFDADGDLLVLEFD
jgi:hypothetical protein